MLRRTRVTALPNWLSPGSLRYAANEAWSNLKATTLGRFDIYHPTTYLRMPMVRAHRVIATHNECTHERFPELFPDRKKVLWARKWLFPRVDAIICCSESTRQDLLHFYNVDPAKTRVIYDAFSPLPRSAESGCRAAPADAPGLHLVCWNEGGLQELPRACCRRCMTPSCRIRSTCWCSAAGNSAATRRALISSLGLGNSVVSMPKVSDECWPKPTLGRNFLSIRRSVRGSGFRRWRRCRWDARCWQAAEDRFRKCAATRRSISMRQTRVPLHANCHGL